MAAAGEGIGRVGELGEGGGGQGGQEGLSWGGNDAARRRRGRGR